MDVKTCNGCLNVVIDGWYWLCNDVAANSIRGSRFGGQFLMNGYLICLHSPINSHYCLSPRDDMILTRGTNRYEEWVREIEP